MVSANDTSLPSDSSPDTVDPRTAANRRNAQSSTGPKTPEGKARSRMNALRHGLCATVSVLPGDDCPTFEAFTDAIYASFKPRDAAEAMLVDQYVSIGWRLRRAGDAEAALNDDQYLSRLRSASVEHARKVRRKDPRAVGPDLDLPPQKWPKHVTGGQQLAFELQRGDGPMLRLMAQEDRLRRTLTQTVRQIKELRVLRKSMEVDDADRGEAQEQPVWERDRSTEVDVMPFRADGAGDKVHVARMIGEAFARQDLAAMNEGKDVVDELDADDPEHAGVPENVQNEPILSVRTDAQVMAEAAVSGEADNVRNEPNSSDCSPNDPGLRCAAPAAWSAESHRSPLDAHEQPTEPEAQRGGAPDIGRFVDP